MTLRGPFRAIRTSLKARLLAGTLVITTLTMGAVFAVVEQRQRTTILEEGQRRGEVLARNLAAISSGPLLLYNFTALEQNVARVAAEADVVYAIVLDPENRVAADSRSPERIGLLLKGSLHEHAAAAMLPLTQEGRSRAEPIYDFAVPVLVSGQKWGTVRVGLSRRRMDAEILTLRWELGALTLAMLLLGGAGAALVARRIAEPVQQLEQGAAAIARGELYQRIEPATADEVGRLAQAFNHMATELVQQRVALEDAHEGLRRHFEEVADLKSYTDSILASLPTGLVTVDLDGRASSRSRSVIALMRSSSVGTTRWNRSRNVWSSKRRVRCRLNVSSEVSGFLISWASPAASVPRAARRSERRSWLSSARTSERSRMTPTAPRSLPSRPFRGEVPNSIGSPLPFRRRSVIGTGAMGAHEASVSIRISPSSDVWAKTSVQ